MTIFKYNLLTSKNDPKLFSQFYGYNKVMNNRILEYVILPCIDRGNKGKLLRYVSSRLSSNDRLYISKKRKYDVINLRRFINVNILGERELINFIKNEKCYDIISNVIDDLDPNSISVRLTFKQEILCTYMDIAVKKMNSKWLVYLDNKQYSVI